MAGVSGTGSTNLCLMLDCYLVAKLRRIVKLMTFGVGFECHLVDALDCPRVNYCVGAFFLLIHEIIDYLSSPTPFIVKLAIPRIILRSSYPTPYDILKTILR